jgi:hypothetical protein
MSTLWFTHVVLPLAQKPPDPADVKQGWLGFGVFLALAVAVVLLWLSLRRQLKKVNFVEQPDPRAGGTGIGPGGSGDGADGARPTA